MAVTYLEWAAGAYPGADFTGVLAAGEYALLGQIAADHGSFDGVALYVDAVEVGSWEAGDASGQADLVVVTLTAGSHTFALQQRDSAGPAIPHDPAEHGSILIIPTSEVNAKTWPSHTVDLAGTAAMSLMDVTTAASETLTIIGVHLETGRLRVKVDGVTYPVSDPMVTGATMWSVTPGAGDHEVGIEIEGAFGAGHGGVMVFGGVLAPPPAGTPLVLPGADEFHDVFGTSYEMNVLGSFTATGPGYVVVRGTNSYTEFAVGTDDFPGLIDTEGRYNAGFSTYPQPGDVYLFRLENAGDYWISSNIGAYDAGITGSGTYDVHYPAGGGTALSYPGTDVVLFGSHVNVLATVAVTEPTAVFVHLTAPLPAGYGLYVIDATETWFFSYDATSGPPGGVDPIPAGTYAFLFDEDSTTPGDWHIIATDWGGYHAGLAGAGTYETHVP